MEKKTENIVLFFLLIFSLYCSLIIGVTWDEPYHYINGLNRVNYLFSLGKYEYRDILTLKYFPGFYDTITAFITVILPKKYEVDIHHIINLIFSLGTIFGIAHITKVLFNRKVSKIVFLILFFNPIFFGHMSMNPKDPLIAFANVWATFFIIKYLQTQFIEKRRKFFSLLIGIFIGFGIGIRVVFLATLLPVFILIFLDFFFLKKIISKNFSFIKFFKDFIKVFLISYFMMVIFWPNVHPNIFILPTKMILIYLSDFNPGSYWGLLNGEFYRTSNTPKLYLVKNLFYKLPEYILLTYLMFIFILFKEQKFFNINFKFFNQKIIILAFIIIFPIIISFFVTVRIFDGLRYYLFLLPYLSIIPGLTIYYLFCNSQYFINKLLIFLLLVSISFFTFNFFSLTPYQYTYLNIFNGKFSEASSRFENDYWGSSIKELVNKIEKQAIFKENINYKIAFCGLNHSIGSHYLKKIKNFRFIKTSRDGDYDFIIMTNRHNGKVHHKKNEVKTCFDSYKGKNILSVTRKGLVLSTIRSK